MYALIATPRLSHVLCLTQQSFSISHHRFNLACHATCPTAILSRAANCDAVATDGFFHWRNRARELSPPACFDGWMGVTERLYHDDGSHIAFIRLLGRQESFAYSVESMGVVSSAGKMRRDMARIQRDVCVRCDCVLRTNLFHCNVTSYRLLDQMLILYERVFELVTGSIRLEQFKTLLRGR
ncbi:hypothetical protein F4820DRAFT_128820 [Hypoxylon rubiginosum]|uniref:Uncharacterized protein n=1 Tax=Hypoxylon rubiginosum TaxID=110542 RepID=A0ACB9YLD5_9PEZI|nr:hypothetical protein F4820DRAFT_128820 [Hypoxylon rubiginosum]